MARQAATEFGGIDVLLNNAAMYDGIEMAPFTELDEAAWDRMFAVNVRGTWNCCKAVVPYLRERGTGTIVNIASTTALIGPPLLLHYTATKGAIVALTRALATELGEEGIRVTGCSPGVTYTQATNNILGDPVLGDIFVEMQAMKTKLQPRGRRPARAVPVQRRGGHDRGPELRRRRWMDEAVASAHLPVRTPPCSSDRPPSRSWRCGPPSSPTACWCPAAGRSAATRRWSRSPTAWPADCCGPALRPVTGSRF